MQTVIAKTLPCLKGKKGSFLKSSFIISLVLSTFMYIIAWLFFADMDFNLREGIEIYFKTLVTTWAYSISWGLICLSVIWIEGKINGL